MYEAQINFTTYAAKVFQFEVGADHEKEGKILTYVIRLVIRTINLDVKHCRRLNHPNVVRFFGYVADSEGTILVTEMVKGADLHRLIFGSLAQTVSTL